MNKTVKQSDLRRAQILSRAAVGTTTRTIAKDLGLSEPAVSRVLALRESQEQLASVIQSLNDQLNERLPSLLAAALDKLEAALHQPYVEYADKLRCIDIVLRVATRLSELSVKSNSQTN